jgi:cell wall-associated NlpC family hydrolase
VTPRTHDPDQRKRTHLGALCAVAVCAALLAIPTSPAVADNGGTGAGGSGPPTGKAKLDSSGDAIPPKGAPPQIVAAIEAANRIDRKPYLWGGGHAKWRSKGYDCSGAVSYVLHAGGFLAHPEDSSGLESWGKRGHGDWITVYANSGHAYATIAGLRWDTAGDARGTGPRWHTDKVSGSGYVKRHPRGY